MNSVYSFNDVALTFTHPNVGTQTLTGEGVGSITIARANDATQHDVAADGSVMASKITTKNGSIALAIQQTSAANEYFNRWYRYLITARTSEWINTTATLRDNATGKTITMRGISPQKLPDDTYQQTGQQVTWNMLAQEIAG